MVCVRPPVLQGVGKTTACGKLALYLQKQKKSVLMVATDVYRPAAIEQLHKLGQVRALMQGGEGGATTPPSAPALGWGGACSGAARVSMQGGGGPSWDVLRERAGVCVAPVVRVCGAQAINVPVFDQGTDAKPVDIAKAGVAEAKRIKADVVIVDTAGRLQVR